MKTEHTPTPWRLQDGFRTIYTTSNPEGGSGITNAIAVVCTAEESSGSIVTPAEAKANGEFIVLAGNAHKGMLETCKSIRNRLTDFLRAREDPPRQVVDTMLAQLNIAINKAGG